MDLDEELDDLFIVMFVLLCVNRKRWFVVDSDDLDDMFLVFLFVKKWRLICRGFLLVK